MWKALIFVCVVLCCLFLSSLIVLAAVFLVLSLSLFVCSTFSMEMGSDEEDQIKNVNVGDVNKNKKKKIDTFNNKDSLSSKSKRQMKTPFQLQTLEEVYAGLIFISSLLMFVVVEFDFDFVSNRGNVSLGGDEG